MNSRNPSVSRRVAEDGEALSAITSGDLLASIGGRCDFWDFPGDACRNIKPLFNFEPPATRNEMHEAALQFVRKISGYTHPSKANEAAFTEAVEDIEKVVRKLLKSLETQAPPRDREAFIAKAKERARERYGRVAAS